MKSRADVEAIVDKVLGTVLRIDAGAVPSARRGETAGWSSLMHVEVFFALEEEFGVRFPEDDMAFAESRDDLVDTVCSALLIG